MTRMISNQHVLKMVLPFFLLRPGDPGEVNGSVLRIKEDQGKLNIKLNSSHLAIVQLSLALTNSKEKTKGSEEDVVHVSDLRDSPMMTERRTGECRVIGGVRLHLMLTVSLFHILIVLTVLILCETLSLPYNFLLDIVNTKHYM